MWAFVFLPTPSVLKKWQSFPLVSIVLNPMANFPVRIDKKKMFDCFQLISKKLRLTS